VWVVRAVSLAVCDVSSDGSQILEVFPGVPMTRKSSTGVSLSGQRSRSGCSEAFPKSSRSVSNWSYISWIVSLFPDSMSYWCLLDMWSPVP